MIKVRNMISSRGNEVPNQFILDTEKGSYFQSYDSIIAFRPYANNEGIILDENKWDYSATTGKYRNDFLGETKKETEKKIKTGVYKLANLN
jgi:hypothetical protein